MFGKACNEGYIEATELEQNIINAFNSTREHNVSSICPYYTWKSRRELNAKLTNVMRWYSIYTTLIWMNILQYGASHISDIRFVRKLLDGRLRNGCKPTYARIMGPMHVYVQSLCHYWWVNMPFETLHMCRHSTLPFLATHRIASNIYAFTRLSRLF